MSTQLGLSEIAASEVNGLWAVGDPPGQYPSTGEPRQKWWTYPSQPSGAARPLVEDRWTWSWQLLTPSTEILSDGRVGVPCFVAGMNGEPGTMATLTHSSLERLQAEGFQLLQKGKYDLVWRVAYPDDPGLLDGADIGSQAHRLADWIHTAFLDLTDAVREVGAR